MSNQTCPICGLDQYPHDTAKTMCFASVDTYGTEGGARDCYKRGYVRLEAVLRKLLDDGLREDARAALSGPTSPVNEGDRGTGSSKWNGLCVNGLHGLDYYFQSCDLCAKSALLSEKGIK